MFVSQGMIIIKWGIINGVWNGNYIEINKNYKTREIDSESENKRNFKAENDNFKTENEAKYGNCKIMTDSYKRRKGNCNSRKDNF